MDLEDEFLDEPRPSPAAEQRGNISAPNSGRPNSGRYVSLTSCPPASAATGPAATPLASPVVERAMLLGALRQTIRNIERHDPKFEDQPQSLQRRLNWQLGLAGDEARLSLGIESDAVHEVKATAAKAASSNAAKAASSNAAKAASSNAAKAASSNAAKAASSNAAQAAMETGSSKPRTAAHTGAAQTGAAAADWMTALGFALRLAVRRLDALQLENPASRPWLRWCWPRALADELGRPSFAGLAHLGLDPARILFVETARASEALIALEDGLKSKSLGLAAGIFNEVALTPARRLSLAADAGHTPCLLVTHPGRSATAATASRWRTTRAPSRPHAFDPRSPGKTCFTVALERCRAAPEHVNLQPLTVEWADETHRFAVAAGLADHPAQTRHASRRSG